MTFLFPKPPKTQPAAQPPQRADASIIGAGQRQTRSTLIGRGIFTSSQGLQRRPELTRRTLIGG